MLEPNHHKSSCHPFPEILWPFCIFSWFYEIFRRVLPLLRFLLLIRRLVITETASPVPGTHCIFCAFRTHVWIVRCTHLLPMVDSIPMYILYLQYSHTSFTGIRYTVYMIYIHIWSYFYILYSINVFVILHHVYVQIIFTLLRYIKVM